MIRTALLGTAALLLPLAAVPAFAQNAPAPAPETAAASDDVASPDEIVVTAQKRSERLQDVPVAVSVISGDQLARAGGINLENVQYQVPALNFRKSGTVLNQSIYLRGVGTATFSIAGEPSVSTVLDGVVLSRSGEAFTDLVDIDRIEVLRGPQGTLFGKNASAGVVNVVSKKPGRDFGGFIDAAFYFDNGNEYRVRGAIDTPFSDRVRNRLTFFYGQYDGNIFNDAPGVNRRVNGYEHYGVRDILVADIGETGTFTLIADWRKSSDDCCGEVISTVNGAPLAGVPGLALAGINFRGDKTRTLRQNLVTRTEEESWGASGQFDFELGDHVVTSITSYRNYNNREIRDGDFVGAAYAGLNQLHDDGPQVGDTFTQELRITSPADQTISYVAGAFYSRAYSRRIFTRNDIVCNPAPTPVALVQCGATGAPASTFPSATATFGSTFTNIALFGQGTINFSSRLRGIIGLRYTIDDLSVFHSRTTQLTGPGIQPSFDAGVFAGGAANGIPFTTSSNTDNLSGKAGLQYDISDDNMVYVTYARGYKGPAYNIFFNLTATGTNEIASEISDSYEIGLKNSFFDGKLTLNIAGYYAEYRNFQANNPDLVAGVVVTRFTNAGDVSTRGAEVDFAWRPLPDLSIGGALTYTDAHVDNFRAPLGAAVIPTGTPLGYAPKWRGALNAEYRWRTGGPIDASFGAQASAQSSQLSLFDANQAVRNAGTIRGYSIVNLQAGIVDAKDAWRLTFVVNNVANESFAAAITNGGPGGSFRYLIPREANRYFGIVGRVNF
ncbi:TonB-dependent receptor [alpha proteobacterium AAP81b]|nr:TonB-dependent receptor [alpha proteobacterium AAP81b]